MISDRYLNNTSKYKTIFNATHEKLGPISILMSTDVNVPMLYKVVYGASTVVFKSYSDAVKFVKDRFKSDERNNFFPLIEMDDGAYTPLFPFADAKDGIKFEFYLERIDDSSYLLHRGKSKGAEPKSINCPFCGRTLNKITNKGKDKYVCFTCQNN